MFFYFLSFSSDYLIKQIFTANKLIDKIELAPSGQYSKDHFLCQIPVFFQLIMNQSPWIYEWNDVWFVKNLFISISVDWRMKKDFVHVRHSNKWFGGFLSFWTENVILQAIWYSHYGSSFSCDVCAYSVEFWWVVFYLVSSTMYQYHVSQRRLSVIRQESRNAVIFFISSCNGRIKKENKEIL